MLTPLDIRHKQFRRSVGGYREREVDDYLERLAQDLEQVRLNAGTLEGALSLGGSWDTTPLAVRTRRFGRGLRGYDPEEVSTFLEEVAIELERAQSPL